MIVNKANPISPNITPTAMNKMIANIEMTNAVPQLHSKQCLIKASQSISWINAAIRPVNNAPKKAPTTVPIATISKASTNFAFCPPTINLPDSQRTGDIIIVETIMFITSTSKLSTNFNLLLHVFRVPYQSRLIKSFSRRIM